MASVALIGLGVPAVSSAEVSNPAPVDSSATMSAALAFPADFRARPPQDEVIYFLLPDRFENGDRSNDTAGITGGKLQHGFDPTDEGFYHGGDIKGLMARLDYIQGLGATAIWMAPVFKNKPVQGEPGKEFSGAHGYWITDFTSVDPHFGTNEDFAALVEAAHARGMKVYMDIITNHTADVIRYRECPQNDCAYRSRADYPYSRQGGVDGAPINDGFDGSDFSRLTNPNYAYTPYIPAGEETVKVPAWLNDPTLYHNRGDSTFAGESSLDGDFAGLDDLFTENPQVVQGMIEIYGDWIDRYGVDGFRIDTAKHVNPEFWQAFVPAMLERARARGIPNFHIFGEVYDHDPGMLARFTHVDRYPAVLDFAFQTTATDVANGAKGTDALDRLFMADALYVGGEEGAMQLPTFLGNHDMGRIGGFIHKAHPEASDAELLARTSLAHALMMFSRGVPVIYYGDEQGFAGQGGYGASRADMFESQVADYASHHRIGGDHAPFDTGAPLYQRLSEMAALRASHAPLRRGLQTVRFAQDKPGLFAMSRKIEGERGETLILFNTSAEALTANVEVDAASTDWTSLRGQCAATSTAPGSVRVSLPPLDYMICVSK
jgi:glycosidase